MPKLTRQTLAVRLRQNWVSKHPQDLPPTACLNMPLDDSLTSLSWLHNLNILKLTPPSEQGGNPPGGAKESPVTPPGEEAPKLEVNINPNAILNMSQLMTDPDLTPLTPVSPLPTLLPPAFPGVLEAVDYTMNPYMKPPYSYATLICMAMRQSEKKKITLAGIYSWIQENYMYYRTSDPSWQNSIRHNLSLNKCFQKVTRRKDEPGKGGFWRLHPDYQDMFVDGVFKKRRLCGGPRDQVPRETSSSPKRQKKVPDEQSSQESVDDVLETVCDIINDVTDDDISLGSMPAEPCIVVKQEPRENPLQVTATAFDDAVDFSWNAILNQDIDVGGVSVKTEDLLNDCSGGGAVNVKSEGLSECDLAEFDRSEHPSDSITSLSPPPSDSSDGGFDDLLSSAFSNEFLEPHDCVSGAALDLTISGVGLNPPDWWGADDHTMGDTNPPMGDSLIGEPPHLPTSHDDVTSHPWAEDRTELDQAIASLDSEIHTLFDTSDLNPSSDTSDLHPSGS